eukprot:scpid82706/ scgid20287/ 
MDHSDLGLSLYDYTLKYNRRLPCKVCIKPKHMLCGECATEEIAPLYKQLAIKKNAVQYTARHRLPKAMAVRESFSDVCKRTSTSEQRIAALNKMLNRAKDELHQQQQALEELKRKNAKGKQSIEKVRRSRRRCLRSIQDLEGGNRKKYSDLSEVSRRLVAQRRRYFNDLQAIFPLAMASPDAQLTWPAQIRFDTGSSQDDRPCILDILRSAGRARSYATVAGVPLLCIRELLGLQLEVAGGENEPQLVPHVVRAAKSALFFLCLCVHSIGERIQYTQLLTLPSLEEIGNLPDTEVSQQLLSCAVAVDANVVLVCSQLTASSDDCEADGHSSAERAVCACRSAATHPHPGLRQDRAVDNLLACLSSDRNGNLGRDSGPFTMQERALVRLIDRRPELDGFEEVHFSPSSGEDEPDWSLNLQDGTWVNCATEHVPLAPEMNAAAQAVAAA